MQRKLGVRYLVPLALLLVLAMALAACSDPEPTATPTPTPTATPTPTPTPAPTATPEPTATPASMPDIEPTTDAPAMGGEGTLRGFFMNPATTGQDLINGLSEEEASCIETTVGEATFQFMLAIPLMAAGSDPSSAAPLFGCLSPENAVLFGIAILDAQAGGWAPETRECITNIGLEHPDAVFIRMGMTMGTGPDAPEETLDFNVQIHECKTDEEKKDFTVALWVGLDRNATGTGQDIYDLLTESEAQCVKDNLSEEEFATMMASRPLAAVQIGATVAHCISKQTNEKIFANGIQWVMGGVRDETLSCLEEFARQHPAFVALLASGIEGIQAMPADQFLTISAAGNEQYHCMSEDEVLRVQEAAAAAMTAGP